MEIANPIVPCLWFDGNAGEAAAYYTGIFPNSRITHTQHYPQTDHEFLKKYAGQVLIVEFELNGQPFTALNGGPEFKFTEAVSLMVMCEDQDEVDYYWGKLSAGGDPAAQQCGWLKDRYGVSWQVCPKRLLELVKSPDADTARRALLSIDDMKKIDLAAVEAAIA